MNINNVKIGDWAYKSFDYEYPSIHVTTDGIETYAVLKEDGKVTKKSVAKCSKDDKFNFKAGVKIAIDRLFEEKKEDKNNFSAVFNEDSLTWITVGKVYDFKDGRTVWDNSIKSMEYNNFEDFKRCNSSLQPFEIKKVKRQAKVGEYIQIIGDIKVINKEGKTTQSGDICIHHYGGYEWFKNIDNDMEIMLTNMYNDTPEYLVLEGYEKYIEYIEKKKKAEFKPHLISSFSGSFYGNIGKESSQVDVLGNRLNIGDTVDLYYGTEPRYETSVVKDANVKTDFVMGLCGIIFSNGKAGDWTIVKKRSYKDVQDGETVGSIKYVKNDTSKAKISTYKY